MKYLALIPVLLLPLVQGQAPVPQFTISTVAGNGIAGFLGDGGPATSAEISTPYMPAVDAAGNFYIADLDNNRIRKVSVGGVITTFAGTGAAGHTGDGGPASQAELFKPSSVFFDPSGNLLIADQFNNVVRKIDTTGTITTIAGTVQGYCGDGGLAIHACLNGPIDAVTDGSGNVYIAEFGSNAIRKIDKNGIITTIAGGNSAGGFGGDGGAATSAKLNGPTGVAVSPSGDIFIADQTNSRIRKISGGIISTIAGTATPGFSGDGGPSTAAQMNGCGRLRLDSSGNLYVSDGRNNRLRVILPNGTIWTVAGNGIAAFSGDGGPALSAEFNSLGGLAITPSGNIYVASGSDNRIRLLAQAVPSQTQILSQLAFGGGWATSLYFTNLTGASVSFPASFVGDDGNPLTVQALGGSSFTVSLTTRGSTAVLFPTPVSLVQGYVSVSLPSGVTGYAVFRQSVPGINDQEAVVTLSPATATTNTLIFDETNYITGVAVANLSSTANTITVTARDSQGVVIGTAPINLPAHGHTAFVLRSTPGLAGIIGRGGAVDFTGSSGNVAALGLRFNGSAFTSIPAFNQ